MVGAIDPAVLAENGHDTPQARVWRRFFAMSDADIKDTFKMIMTVEQGPWLVKRAIPQKPLIIGRQLKMWALKAPCEHMEIVFDVASGRSEQMAVGIAMKGMSSMHFSLCALIEGRQEDELPEAPLLCAGCQHVDTSAFLCPQMPATPSRPAFL
jgi:hypothetical protein